MVSDDDILTGMVDDLDTGFIDLVRVHQPGIYSGAYRLLRNRHDAEDVAQDTFARAYRALEGYDADRIRTLRLRGWLWTIALNLCRTRGSRPAPVAVDIREDDLSHRDGEPFDTDHWNVLLARLSDDQRTAVVLRHVVDLSIADIALITDRPEGTVKADISRGLQRLRSSIDTEATP